MKKRLFKIGSLAIALAIAVTPAMHVSADVQNGAALYAEQDAPSVYTDRGEFTVTNGINDGRWYFNAATGVLDVYGTGSTGGSDAPWHNKESLPWKNHRTEVKEIIFHEGITDISNQAIGNGSNDSSKTHTNLEKVTIPSSITEIHYGAFANCTKLKDVVFAEGLTKAYQGAFLNTAIETLTLPNSLKTIVNGAFSNCLSLKTINLGSGIETIDINAFASCPELRYVSPLPESLNTLGNCAFAFDTSIFKNENYNLKSITFLGDLPTLTNTTTLDGVFGSRRRYVNVHYNPEKNGWSTLDSSIRVVLYGDAQSGRAISNIWLESNDAYSIYPKDASIVYTATWYNNTDATKTLTYTVTYYDGTVAKSGEIALDGTANETTIELSGKDLKKGHYVLEATIDGCSEMAEFAIVEKLASRRNTSKTPFSFATMSTHTAGPGADLDKYMTTVKLAGINYVRDFGLLSEFFNSDGSYNLDGTNNVKKYLNAYEKHDIGVMFMLSTPPSSWKNPNGNDPVPYDPAEVYDFIKAFCQHNAGKVDTIEILNEVDTGYDNRFGTPDSHAAVLKAAALAAADSGTGIKVASCGFCGGLRASGEYRNSFLLNDTAKYFDYYVGHDYINYMSEEDITKKDSFPRSSYPMEVARFGEKSTYMSEYGIRIPFTTKENELTLTEQKNQARSTPVNLINSLKKGYDRPFWFIHSYINEYQKQYGTMNKRYQPYMVYSAISALTNAIGNGRYKGQFQGLADGVYGHKFVDGNEQIACFWSDSETTVTLNTNAKTATLIDIMGNETTITSTNGSYTIKVSPDITYVRLRGTISNAVNSGEVEIVETQELFQDTITDADRIVTKMFFDESAYKKNVMYDGYRLSTTSTNNATIKVYNFGDTDATGSLRFSSNAGWTVSGNYTNITVPANGELEIPLTISGAGVTFKAVKTQLIVKGNFNGEEITDTVVNLNTVENITTTDNVFDGFAKKPTTILGNAINKYWSYSASDITVTEDYHPDEDYIGFTVDFTNSTNKGIGFTHSFGTTTAFVGSAGFTYQFRTDFTKEGTTPNDGEKVELLVQGHAYTTDGCHYYTTLLKNADRYTNNYLYSDENWQQAVFQWSDFVCASSDHDHSGVKLDPSKINGIGIGFIAQSGENIIDFQVKDMGLINFANYSTDISLTASSYDPKTETITATLSSANVSGVRFKDETGKVFNAEISGNTATAKAPLERGTHTLTAYIFDNYNSPCEDTLTVTAEEKYTLSYHTVDGAAVPKPCQVVKDSLATVTDYKPQKTGFAFLGWADTPNALSANYHAGDTISMTKDFDLYPVFASGLVFGTKTVHSETNALVKGNIPESKGKTASLVITKGKQIAEVSSFDDIYHMDEVLIDADGNYSFTFPADESIANYKAVLNIGGETNEVSLSSAVLNYEWIDISATANVDRELGKVNLSINDIDFSRNNAKYKPIIAFYDSEYNLITCSAFEAEAINDRKSRIFSADLPTNAKQAKIFVWGDLTRLSPVTTNVLLLDI